MNEESIKLILNTLGTSFEAAKPMITAQLWYEFLFGAVCLALSLVTIGIGTYLMRTSRWGNNTYEPGFALCIGGFIASMIFFFVCILSSGIIINPEYALLQEFCRLLTSGR